MKLFDDRLLEGSDVLIDIGSSGTTGILEGGMQGLTSGFGNCGLVVCSNGGRAFMRHENTSNFHTGISCQDKPGSFCKELFCEVVDCLKESLSNSPYIHSIMYDHPHSLSLSECFCYIENSFNISLPHQEREWIEGILNTYHQNSTYTVWYILDSICQAAEVSMEGKSIVLGL